MKKHIIDVPGDGYCGLHASVLYACLVFQLVNNPTFHQRIDALESGFIELKEQFTDAYVVQDPEFQKRLLDLFMDFPVWRQFFIDYFKHASTKASLLATYAEHMAYIRDLKELSGKNLLSSSMFFGQWQALSEIDDFEKKLLIISRDFLSGEIHDNYDHSIRYYRMFKSFCEQLRQPKSLAIRDQVAKNLVGSDQNLFYFDKLHHRFKHYRFMSASPDDWLHNNDIVWITETLTGKLSHAFNLVGLSIENKKGEHWVIAAQDRLWSFLHTKQSRLSCPVSYCDSCHKPKFSLDYIESCVDDFIDRIEYYVDVGVKSNSFWDCIYKNHALKIVLARVEREINDLRNEISSGMCSVSTQDEPRLEELIEKLLCQHKKIMPLYLDSNKDLKDIHVILRIILSFYMQLCRLLSLREKQIHHTTINNIPSVTLSPPAKVIA
ncbi:MAG: hypothetical protein VX112_05645 [Pseudomonadota bacterium]|nr:hypothetical protein [Pseudomonadota bacterium]